MSRPLSWVVGRGGLLGSATEEALARRERVWVPHRAVPWSDQAGAAGALRAAVRDFLRAAGTRPWRVLWCAGAGVTGTTREELDDELAILRAALEELEKGSRTAGPGTFFFASSAGGVYAGVRGSPFDERSPVAALAPYGEAKLAAEQMVIAWARRSGVPALVGRIANLYGPGQDLGKSQGLVSHLCRAQLAAQPLTVFVPLDTMRDYLFAPDCGALVADAMARLDEEVAAGGTTPVVTKILASQRSVTVGALIAEIRRVNRRAPRIVLGASPVSAYQARDLRFRSVVWPELDRRSLTPLPAGVKATAEGLARDLQRRSLRT